MELSLNDIAGHLAFALSACAYSMRRIVWLRVFAICSLSLSLYYNLTLSSGPLWLVVFWLGVFLFINLLRISLELADNIETRLDPETKRILAVAFPTLHSRDWQKMSKIAEKRLCAPGTVVLNVGDETDEVSLLMRGTTCEERADGRRITRDAGTIWGELTYALGSAEFNGSPCRITAGPNGATVIAIPYPALRQLSQSSHRLRAALNDGFVRSAGVKHGLLEHKWELPEKTRLRLDATLELPIPATQES